MAEDIKDPADERRLPVPALDPLVIISANIFVLGEYVSTLLKLGLHHKGAANIKRAIRMQDKEEVCRLIRVYETMLDFKARQDIRQASKTKGFVAPRIGKIKLSELDLKDMTKKQLYGKLVDGFNLYLPSFSCCSLDFMHQICTGLKYAFNKREVAYVNPPEYPELYEKDFIVPYTSKEPYSKYLPDETTDKTSFRKFMFSVINTLTSGEISLRIDQLRTAKGDPIPSNEKVLEVLSVVAEAVANAIVLPSKRRQTSLLADLEVKQDVSPSELEKSIHLKYGRKFHQVDNKVSQTSKRCKLEASELAVDDVGEVQVDKKKYSAEYEAEKYKHDVIKGKDCTILGEHGPDVDVEFKAKANVWRPGRPSRSKRKPT